MMEGSSLEIVGVSCQNCVAACCKAGAAMQVTEHEAYMNKRKMNLVRQLKARPQPQSILVEAEGFNETGKRIPVPTPMIVPAYHGLYLLLEDCGHLTADSKCGIYGSSDRPRACAAYEVGSSACLDARKAAGIIDSTPDS